MYFCYVCPFVSVGLCVCVCMHACVHVCLSVVTNIMLFGIVKIVNVLF